MKNSLKKYDNKIVRINCIDGKTYEGICSYNSKDYTFHEYGKNEESLEIFHFLFYNNDIKEINIIDNFSSNYGEIEIETANDISLLEQTVDDENDIHVYRLLCYLDTIELNNDIIILLKNLIKYNENEKIVKKASEIINKRKEKL